MKWKVISRWIALVPTVFIGCGILKEIMQGCFRWSCCSVFGFDPDGSISHYGSLFVGNVFYGAAIVYSSYFIAPSHKKKTALILAIFNIVIVIAMILYAFYSRSDVMFLLLFYWGSLIASCIVALIDIFQNKEFYKEAPE